MRRNTIAEKLGSMLKRRGMTLAVAESCTGGLVGGAITAIPGSSAFFRGGVIAYENNVKHRVLGVPVRILERHGAVSAHTVIAMARGAQKLLTAECAIAVSGVAGPGGGTKEKPVGLVWIGIAVKKEVHAFEERFSGNRSDIRNRTVKRALEHCLDALKRS